MIAADVPDLLRRSTAARSPWPAANAARHGERADAGDRPRLAHRLLTVITEPEPALILMMLGVYGLIFEFSNPGFGLPGMVGGICLLLALFAFSCCRSTTPGWR